MKDLLLVVDRWLPHWLEGPKMQWVQWVYALWQVIRCNPLTLLVLSMPFYIWVRWIQKKRVVVVGESRDYYMPLEEFYLHQWRSLEIVSHRKHRNNICDWYLVKHRKCCYLAQGNNMRELATCERDFGENVVFVERLLTVTDAISVGKMLSQTEAYERVLSFKGRHISKGPRCVVPTFLDYIDLNSKLWGVLSTIPIILQARNYNRFSTFLSLAIIVLDLNRRWLYAIYDNLSESFTKFVKLHIFKERSSLYHLFSVFSSRWRYCDPVKQCAYVAGPDGLNDTPRRLRPYSKLISCEDLDIIDFESYLDEEDKEVNYHMEIDMDRAHFLHKRYDDLVVVAKLRRPIYVL